jgi:hypothetical protein
MSFFLLIHKPLSSAKMQDFKPESMMLFSRLSRTNMIFVGTGMPWSFLPISTMTEARIFARLRRLRIFL